MNIQVSTEKERNLLIKEFERLDIYNIEGDNRFVVGILDRFSKCLNEDEVQRLLIQYNPNANKDCDIQRKYIKQEKAYLKFFERVFCLNNKKEVFIHSPELREIKKGRLLNQHLTYINKNEASNLLNLLLIHSDASDLFKTNDLDVIKFFVLLSTREICLSTFFFPDCGCAIVGNYEMVFPLYCKNNETFNNCTNIARMLGLYLR